MVVASRRKLLVIYLTLTQMKMSCLFLAAIRDSQKQPSHTPDFLNIQSECEEVVALFVCMCVLHCGVGVSVYVHLTKRRDYQNAANIDIMIPLI